MTERHCTHKRKVTNIRPCYQYKAAPGYQYKGNLDPFKLCHWHLREVTHLPNTRTYRACSFARRALAPFCMTREEMDGRMHYGNTLKALAILVFIVAWSLLSNPRARECEELREKGDLCIWLTRAVCSTIVVKTRFKCSTRVSYMFRARTEKYFLTRPRPGNIPLFEWKSSF